MKLIVLTALYYIAAGSDFVQAQGHPDPELRKALLAAVNESDSFPDRFDAEVWLTDMSAMFQ
jgi:hypothetical protein